MGPATKVNFAPTGVPAMVTTTVPPTVIVMVCDEPIATSPKPVPVAVPAEVVTVYPLPARGMIVCVPVVTVMLCVTGAESFRNLF
jgi:hypothetical protein